MVTIILHCLAWRARRPHLIALLMTVLMVCSFLTMTWRANAASVPPYPGHPVSLGSTGRSVELIQAALNRLGAHLAVDGIFGPLTRAAVIRFQRAHQLEADGIVDPLTWRALFNSDVPGPSSDPTAGYINPIQPGLWAPSRTDQGVDWLPLQPNTPVLAIGAGVVTFSSLHSYWVGGGNITYELTAGPKAGLYIYVTEHLTSVLPVGSTITPGEVIATAQPGYPWTEWGWAKPPGTGSYAPAVPYSGTPDGSPTAGGLAMARFFRELGATTLQDPGPGPDTPYPVSATVTPTSTPVVTPSPQPITTPPSAVSSANLPGVGSSYSGTIYNIFTGVTTQMTLGRIRENQGTITGYFTGLNMNDSFKGGIDAAHNIQFTITDPVMGLTLSFEGMVRADHSLAGSYCTLDQDGQCGGGGYGIWSVSP